MPNNELEQGLRDRLYDLEEAVNTDATWLAVQAGLQPPKKKRRGIIWWWLSGSFVLLAISGWLLWPSGDSDHPGLQTEQMLAEKATVAPVDAEQIADRTEEITAGNSTNNPTPESEQKARPEVRQASNVLADRGLVGDTGDGSTVNSTPILTSIAPARRRPNTVIPQTLPAQQATSEETGTEKEETTKRSESLITSRMSAAVSIATLPIPLLALPFNDDAFSPLPPINDVTDCYTFGKANKPGWTLGAGAGVAQPYRTIVAPTEGPAGQRARNLATESPLEAITADLLVGYQTASKWTLRGGLSYQRINSVVEVRSDSTAEERREGITEIIINSAGDTTVLTGLVDASVRTSAYNRYYNHLTTVDFPLLLGKTFAKGKWRIGVEAGPVINLISSGSARYQLANGTYSTRADNDGLFRKRLGGISWRANVSAGLLIMPGLEANIGLSALRRGRGGFEVEDSATRTAYDLLGIRVGIRRSF